MLNYKKDRLINTNQQRVLAECNYEILSILFPSELSYTSKATIYIGVPLNGTELSSQRICTVSKHT